jgi:hypothetical protein
MPPPPGTTLAPSAPGAAAGAVPGAETGLVSVEVGRDMLLSEVVDDAASQLLLRGKRGGSFQSVSSQQLCLVSGAGVLSEEVLPYLHLPAVHSLFCYCVGVLCDMLCS